MQKYKDWSGMHKGVTIVCSEADQKYYNTTDAEWIFERTQGAESATAYQGTIKLRNVGTRETLENWKSEGK